MRAVGKMSIHLLEVKGSKSNVTFKQTRVSFLEKLPGKNRVIKNP